jgi:steroid delta-isomerase
VLVWDFTFRIKKYKPEILQRIRGVSHIRFNAEGKVNYHRDYWDAAEELYEKLPLVGGLMRFLKRRVG